MTSGGDAPGMNAAIRAVVRKAIYHGIEVVGISLGFSGLILGDFQQLNGKTVGDIIHRGGTILRTARSEEFRGPVGQRTAAENLKGAGIQGVVVIGGDGSLRGALRLAEYGIAIVGIPATIDNDIPCTDYTIGFDTAVNTVVDAINKIRDTAASHERVIIIEVMGRRSGHIALMAGIAGGAETIFIPEVEVNLEEASTKILRGRDRGKPHSIILVAEGVGSAIDIGKEIKKRTGMDTRVTILGHIQRGGTPTAFDRMIASQLGAEAVSLFLKEAAPAVMVGLEAQKVTNHEIEHVLQEEKKINLEAYYLAEILAF